ncbi:SDR family oxidoreductase [Marinovum sp. 2_MG-2023]|uniref:SDR family NAD(P)-dependent oxidoreductase n=1 Tax=unclassified Marinovum TaxID=2647166 RepID=UPI0026E351C3|nr:MULTISPECIES: glucose 1-dehydrogenase [unclassified Marinovum]MDO6731617.1 SDR family oxidoreductase [Marinovum sp. 2_MG-2023]MDO6778257.1 SDR family oxidoreductase [Marinovum sp. 1_MG-2023]
MGLLDGKFAIITGAASPRGLGKATATLFAEHGARVAILDLDADHAAAAALDLPGDGHVGLPCDVTQKKACDQAVQILTDMFGRIDILVNNAGITQPLKLMEIEADHYDAVTDVSLRGTLYMSQAVIPTMRAQKSGSIINLSSVSAQRGGGIFGGPHYSAAKAGVLGLTKAMARELAPDNVRSNAICPGFIATDITAGKLTPAMKEQVLAGIPMGRAGTAVDVAGCALFLASDLSSYCTGSEVDVNGGSLIH